MANTKKSKKAALNTSIDAEVKNDFKETCDEICCPMGLVLETFMRQFNSGEFSLRLGKNHTSVDLKDDVKEIENSQPSQNTHEDCYY